MLAALLLISCGESVNHELIISNVNIVDVETGEILPNKTLGIDSNRISAIYESPVSASWSSEEMDGKDGYLIPGLWDMHTHFYWNEKEASRLLLANGVTGIREMWGVMDSTNAFREKNKQGYYAPDIYSAGNIIDGRPQVWEGSAEVTTAEEARAEVLKQIEEGVDFIKVYSKLNKESFDAIAETASENGIPFAGHVPNELSIFYTAQKGMASAEHMFGVLPGVSTIGDSVLKTERTVEYQYIETYSEERFDSLCRIMVEKDMWLCPTLTVNKVFTTLDKPEEMQNSPRLDYINKGLKNLWYAYTSDSASAAQEMKTFNSLLPLVGKAHAKGVKILAGTDFPNPYTYPGFSIHDELKLLVESGMSELAALQAATSAAASFIKKSNDFGTVSEGKIASLVLLEKNPLEDIANTSTIAAVFQRGQMYDKESLEKMLSDVKEEIINAATPYSEVFRQLMNDIGFNEALDSVSVLISTNSADYILDENDMGFVIEDFYKNEEVEKMMKYSEYMIQWFPQSSMVHTWTGEVMMMGERNTEAKNYFKKALELDPENSRAQESLDNME